MFQPVLCSVHRLHSQNRANGSSGEDRYRHLVPDAARLAHILRSQAGHHRESGIDVSAGAIESPRCSAQAWHGANKEAQRGDTLCVVVLGAEIGSLLLNVVNASPGLPVMCCNVADRNVGFHTMWSTPP